jgi:cytochrome c556
LTDIPDRPHPNCKCYVKDIHIGTEDYESLQREIDKIYGDLSSLRDQILTSMNEEESDIQNSEIQDLLDDVYAFEYDLDEVSSDFEQVSEEDSTGNFERFKAKINEIKNNFQELKQKIIEKINGLKKEVCDCIDTIKKFFKTDDGKTVSYQPSFPIKPAIYSCVLTESVLQIKPTNQSKRCMIKEIIKPASYPCVPVLSPLAALME